MRCWDYRHDSIGLLTGVSAVSYQGTSNPCACNPPPDVDENGNLCTYEGSWSVVPWQTFTYDAVGNRTDQGGDYGAGNRIRQFAGCAYTTDSTGDGNVLSRTCGTQTVRFHWSTESHLKAMKLASADTLDFR